MTALREEKDYVARCETALRRMLDGARLNVVVGETVAGDRYSAERLGRHLKSLAEQLDEEPGGPPFFGRLDFGAGDHAGRRYYIGRRHISGEVGEQPVVIDWRAPVSRAFYRAGARDPQGVTVRRRFGWAGTELTGFEDERLDLGRELGGASRILAAEIERPRVGPMRDIVATIQPEQDDLVRAMLEESICVQGAPGTGKTAVGLHRAAYLLYAHRRRLERAGVLVLGPNRAFIGYIAAVLPALGEVDVEQTTVEELLAAGPSPGTARGADGEAAAVVKHDARMARVLRRALYARVRRPQEPLVVADGSYRWRVPEPELRRIVDDTRREATPYAVGRERVRSRVVALLRRQAEIRGRSTGAGWERKMGRGVTAFLDEVWPAVRAEEVVAGLLSDPRELAAAADGVLTPPEQAAIGWARPPRSVRTARWSSADLVLIDEVAGLLERPRGYGHVIVDEAQDLSAMQCRAVARRSEHGSLTVLGDLAQGTTPWAARDWPALLAHLGKPEAKVIALSTGFRVPAAVVALANRLLAALDVDVPPTRSHRSDGTLRVTAADDVPRATVAAVREALRHEGSIGVIAADDAVEGLTAALWDAGLHLAGPESGGRISVMPATLVKGLEYDHVVVAEPADIVRAERRGLNRLYVALTRAVSRLDVLHSRPLPAPLAGPAG
ncbi:DNA helicase [Microtetraspora sp. NBRC 13810]|uniref:HelD family protein n=1 Tax=Microtetraspora sp. NBRC 13810 TaxID=3030990 RepID=UPI0024A00C09|nr:AAA family ATPase [Microtetraspora sp. NBRC 13810]GLW06500.1 DNA helicase [Microtetraspora sp. NBRC 13810]